MTADPAWLPTDSPLPTGGALRGPLWEELAERLEQVEGLATGASVGPYRVVREVGRGGMAVVYLAERADGLFEQRVALKLMRRAGASAELVRRFEQERRILASLSHPAIARLLDAGVTADGHPYFAMEYVEGTSIDQHCDERRLTIDERLRLFSMVAQAVQAAHRGLVVHRDLKPSNVLVSEEGEVKLLDFGIARPLDAETATGTALTLASLRVLTPEYASPEQVRGEPITTATDVYQLGLLLYDLLAGRRALAVEGSTHGELERVICEVEPRPPSEVLREPSRQPMQERGATGGPGPAEIAAARGTTPEALSKRLAGDLDAIVLTALAKEPGERYASVGDLLADLARHADGRPVLARRPTLAYRAGKFLRRNRFGAAAAALLAASIVAGVSTTTWQAVRARRAAADSESVAEYLAGLFELARPGQPQGEAVTARELLDRSALRLDAELADQPALKARLQGVLGRVYSSLGLYGSAAAQLEGAAAFHRQDGGDPRELARTLSDLAGVRYNQGAYGEAATLARDGLALERQLYGEEHEEIAVTLRRLGLAHTGQGDQAAAEPLFRESLAMRRRLLGDRHPAVVESLNDLATSLFARGDFPAAEALYREALAISRALPGDAYPSLPDSMAHLAAVLGIKGDQAGAESLLREALARLRERLGDDHPALAPNLRNLATTVRRRGGNEEAAALYHEVLRIQRLAYGAEHHEVAKTTYDLAGLLHEQGDLPGAELLYRQSVDMLEKLVGPQHPHYARALAGLARVELDQGGAAAAEARFRQALVVLESKLPAGHPFIVTARQGLDLALAAQR